MQKVNVLETEGSIFGSPNVIYGHVQTHLCVSAKKPEVPVHSTSDLLMTESNHTTRSLSKKNTVKQVKKTPTYSMCLFIIHN